MSLRLFSSFIVKTKNPCIKCVNYIQYKYGDPYEELYDSETRIGKCSLFGKENIVTGVVEHDNAFVCRNTADKCGEKGKYFVSLNKNE